MIRFATLQDVSALLDIYQYYVLHETATFEYAVPTHEEFTRRMEQIISVYPYLVYEEDNRILGYAYASRYKERAAYQWNVEASIYLHPQQQGKGLGSHLYRSLLSILKLQGVHHAYACITSPNPRSETMHKRLGFQRIGTFSKTGYKFNQWLDVVWMEKELQSFTLEPVPVCPLPELVKHKPEEVRDLLKIVE